MWLPSTARNRYPCPYQPLLPNVYKIVTHAITILQHLLQNCYCVCDHFVCIGKQRVGLYNFTFRLISFQSLKINRRTSPVKEYTFYVVSSLNLQIAQQSMKKYTPSQGDPTVISRLCSSYTELYEIFKGMDMRRFLCRSDSKTSSKSATLC